MGHDARVRTPIRSRRGRLVALLLAATALATVPGCARRALLLELHASVLHDKPRLEAVRYELDDARRAGGGLVLAVTLEGDPGLAASVDVGPDVLTRAPLSETEPGRYAARIELPDGLVGGPYSVVGRVRHPRAGEAVRSAPRPFTVPFVPSGR